MAAGISLDPENPPGSEPELPLGALIQRITQERGSFTKLNERELEESDRAAGSTESMEVSPTSEEPNTEKETEENDFARLRSELMAKVGTALNESALNLDFVSLLVSASRPQAGESSMSPMLKSQIPPASFNADTVTQPAPTLPAHSGYGWKIKAYNQSAEHLSNSANELAERVKLERQFWHDMLYTTTQNGEVANRKLQIKYGYMDSGSDFIGGGHGFGMLQKRIDNGHAVFLPRNGVDPELVQVSVFADSDTAAINGRQSSMDVEETKSGTPPPDRLIGRSVIPFDFALDHLEEPLKSIRYERNWLFEHELMQQITREARTSLASHNVMLQNGKRIVCAPYGLRIEIELVKPPPKEESEANLPARGSGDLINYATAINYGLHLLLIDWFHENLKKTHSKPEPLNTHRRPEKNTPPILKSVLAHIQQSILVGRAIRLVQVMLPDAEITTHSDENATLQSAPFSTLEIKHNDRQLELEIRAPVTMGDNPPIIGKLEGITPTRVFDLTELEMWLKWIS